LAGQTLLVYGSAPVADQEELIGLLTLDPVGDAANDCDTEQLQ
jgi:predicted transcriptional regulator